MPNRILKESICTSDTIDQLNWFEEALYYRLIVSCDDFGRFDGRCAIIKNRLFPLKESVTMKSVESALNRLATVGLVALYEVDGRPYLQLPTWGSHQRIRNQKSKYPVPTDGNPLPIDSNLPSVAPVIQSESKSNPNPEAESNAGGGAYAYLLDKINPNPGRVVLDGMKPYVESLGDEVCIRAMDIALGEKSTGWAFIKAILQRYARDGVKCLADAINSDERRTQGRTKQGAGGNLFLDMLEEKE